VKKAIFKKLTVEAYGQVQRDLILLDESNIELYAELRGHDYTMQCAKELIDMHENSITDRTFIYILTHIARFMYTCPDIYSTIMDMTCNPVWDWWTNNELAKKDFLTKLEEEHGGVLQNIIKYIEQGKDVLLNSKGGFMPVEKDNYKVLGVDYIDGHTLNNTFCGYKQVKDDYETYFVYYNKVIYTLESKLGGAVTHENIVKYYNIPSDRCCRFVYKINNITTGFGGIEGLSESFVYDFMDKEPLNKLKKQDLDIIEKFCEAILVS